MTLFERTDLRKLLFRIATALESQESQLRRIRVELNEITDLMQQSQAADGKKEIYGDKSEE